MNNKLVIGVGIVMVVGMGILIYNIVNKSKEQAEENQ
jgi:hypothetical protein